MILYHCTDAAEAILKVGFRDSTNRYMTETEFTGVFFSDVPLGTNEGAKGDTHLRIEIPEELISEYEWIEDFKTYREFCIPASLANEHGPPVKITEEEADELWRVWAEKFKGEDYFKDAGSDTGQLKHVISELQAIYERLGHSEHIQYPRWSAETELFRHSQLNDCLLVYLKGVRWVSLLNASMVLLEAGHVHEMGILCRCMDETHEDIMLFIKGLGAGGGLSDAQQRVFDDFFQEQFVDKSSPMLKAVTRDRVPRRKVRSSIAGLPESPVNSHDHAQMMSTIDSVYSGYVHGAYPHIMELCAGMPPRYMMSGMNDTPRIEAWHDQLLTYVYRAVLGSFVVAKRLGAEAGAEMLLKLRSELEQVRPEFAAEPTQLLRDMKRKKK